MAASIFGAYDSRDLVGVSIADYTQDRAVEDMRRFAERYQANLEALLAEIAVFDTIAKTNFGVGVTGELQPNGEYSQGVEATRTEGEWAVEFPIARFGDRQIYTKEYLARVDLSKLEKDTIAAAIRDATTMRKMVLRALLLKTNWTFVDRVDFPGVGLGTLTIRRLFNADGQSGEVPDLDGVGVAIGSLQHYIGSGSATWANSFFVTLRNKMEAVGLGEDLVVWIARANVADVTGLSGFEGLGDPNIIDPTATRAIVRSARAIGRMKQDSGDMEVQVMPGMPTGYLFCYDRTDPPPVLIRQPREAEFQGFYLTDDDTRASYDSQPLRNRHWERIAGAGVRNRRNGVAMQVVASATYTDPNI